MDTRIDPGGSRRDVIATPTAPRVTPSSGVAFRDMVARGAGAILRGAEAAISSLPGAPIVAAAVRPTGTPSPIGVGGGMGMSGGMGATGVGVGGATSYGVPRTAIGAGSAENPVGGVPGGPGAENPSVEGALAQSQEFNLYYLQLQEQLSAENRAFSAMSNVLKTRHDTVKNAIGNIR
jgi:hypothetical protein